MSPTQGVTYQGFEIAMLRPNFNVELIRVGQDVDPEVALLRRITLHTPIVDSYTEVVTEPVPRCSTMRVSGVFCLETEKKVTWSWSGRRPIAS